jgi:hypothetical protein
MKKLILLSGLIVLARALEKGLKAVSKNEGAQSSPPEASANPGPTTAPPRKKRVTKMIDGVLCEKNPVGFGWREVGSDPGEPYWVRRLN